VTVSLRKRQHIRRTHAIKLGVRVSEQSVVAGTATVNVGHAVRVLRFKRSTRDLTAGRRVTMKLKLSKSSLKRLLKAFRRKHSFAAKITVSARDAAGNVGSRRKAVSLLR
jgi:hypothetical protein